MAFEDIVAGGTSGLLSWTTLAAIWTFIVASLAFVIVAYVLFAFAWMTIGKKLKYKYPWLAWIPFANISMILQMGGFHWAWVFLILVPFAGVIVLMVLSAVATWKIFEKRKYPGWLALTPLVGFVSLIGALAGIAYIVILCVVAWRDNK